MLTTCPTKTCKDMSSSVVSSGLRQSSNGPAHGLISNCNKTHGHFFNTQWIFSAFSALSGQKFIDLKIDRH